MVKLKHQKCKMQQEVVWERDYMCVKAYTTRKWNLMATDRL